MCVHAPESTGADSAVGSGILAALFIPHRFKETWQGTKGGSILIHHSYIVFSVR